MTAMLVPRFAKVHHRAPAAHADKEFIFQPAAETMPREQLAALQLKSLRGIEKATILGRLPGATVRSVEMEGA
jgi:hypothetical protein